MAWNTKDLTDSTREYYYGFDYVRILLALLVLTIHIPVNSIWFTDYIHNGFARLAVPTFFTMSSFLYFLREKETVDKKESLKLYCFKMIRLYGTWTALLVLGGREHLWYLSSSAIGMLIVFFLNEKMSVSKAFLVTIVLYFIGCFVELFGEVLPLGVLKPMFVSVYRLFLGGTMRNGIFFAPIFICIGRFFAYKRISLSKRISRFLLLGILGIYVIEICLVHYLHLVHTWDFYFTLPIVTAILFYNIAKVDHLRLRLLKINASQFAFLFYVLQLFSRWIYEYILFRLNIFRTITWPFTEYFCVAVMTGVMALGIMTLTKYKGFHFLEYLYR